MDKNSIYLNLEPVRENSAPTPYNTVVELSAYSDERLGKLFRTAYEIPILQGEREVRPDGTVIYRMNLTPEQAEPLLRAINEITFKSSQSLN